MKIKEVAKILNMLVEGGCGEIILDQEIDDSFISDDTFDFPVGCFCSARVKSNGKAFFDLDFADNQRWKYQSGNYFTDEDYRNRFHAFLKENFCDE